MVWYLAIAAALAAADDDGKVRLVPNTTTIVPSTREILTWMVNHVFHQLRSLLLLLAVAVDDAVLFVVAVVAVALFLLTTCHPVDACD